MTIDVHGELDRAVAAARAAGALLTTAAARGGSVLADVGRDIKLAADRQAEACIIEHLEASGIPVLAEEGGAYGALDLAGDAWVVDPLDGTMNYSRDIPICCTSIALFHKGEPLLGVIYDFNRDELFTGIVGEGAWLNGETMRVSEITRADRAILAMGFPASRDFSTETLAPALVALQQFRKVRMLGSAAIMLAYVAAGRFDAYWEDGIMLWDVGAGLAIVQGAGGHVERALIPGAPWACRVRCAAAASIWQGIPHIPSKA